MWDAFRVCTFSTKCVLISGWSPIRSAPYAEWTSRLSCPVKVDIMFQNSCLPSHSHPSWYCSQPKMAWLYLRRSGSLELGVLTLLHGTATARPTTYVHSWFWCIYKSFCVFFSRFDISSCIILLYFCMIPCIAFLCTYYGLVTLNLQARLAALVSSILWSFCFCFCFFVVVFFFT